MTFHLQMKTTQLFHLCLWVACRRVVARCGTQIEWYSIFFSWDLSVSTTVGKKLQIVFDLGVILCTITSISMYFMPKLASSMQNLMTIFVVLLHFPTFDKNHDYFPVRNSFSKFPTSSWLSRLGGSPVTANK